MTGLEGKLTGQAGIEERFADGPVVVFTWRNEPGWPVEYVSPNVERLLGYSPAELYAGDPPYAALVHDDDLDRVGREVEQNSDATTERFHHQPYRMVTKDGGVRWVLDYTRIRRDGGEITGYTGYIIDITERKTQLEYVNALNATIRSLQSALVDADSRAAIHEDVCTALGELDGFGGVWVGTLDTASERIVPAASSGIPDGFFENLSFFVREDSPIPAARVATGDERDGHAIAGATSEETWCEAMLAAGYQSVYVVPIRHRELRHGVLVVYGTARDTFDNRIRRILSELGELVGYAITAVERRDALHGDGDRDLVLGVAIDHDDPLRLLADRLSGTVEVRSVSQRKNDTPLLYCLLPGTDPETAVAITSPGIEAIEPLSTEPNPMYGITTERDCVASRMTALGASLRSMRITHDDCELVVSVRRERDRHRFIDQTRELFGSAELRAERGRSTPETRPWAALLTGALTEQQRNVLKAAYHAGYFDEDRKRTGSEIAESLGIAQPTFAAHLRAAQRNLLSAIWDDPDSE